MTTLLNNFRDFANAPKIFAFLLQGVFNSNFTGLFFYTNAGVKMPDLCCGRPFLALIHQNFQFVYSMSCIAL